MRRHWIALALALAGCGNDAQPDCSLYHDDETPPFVPDGVVRLNGNCNARCPVIAAAGDGFLVAWAEGAGEMSRLRVRRLDSSGAPSGPFHDFPSGGCPAIAHGNDITAVAWYDNGIRLVRFDEDGMAIGDPVLASPNVPRGGAPSLAASSDGYALVWVELRSALGPQDIYFAALDQEGAPLGEPRILAAGETEEENGSNPFWRDTTLYDGPAVAAVPDGFVAVWYTRTTIEMHHLDSGGIDLGTATSQAARAPNWQYEYDLVEYIPHPLHLAASYAGVLTGWPPMADRVRLHVTNSAAPSLETGTTTRLTAEANGYDPSITPTVSPDGFLALWKSVLPGDGRALAWVSLDEYGDQVGEIEYLRVDVDGLGRSVDVAHGADGYVLVFATYYDDVYAIPLPM